MRLQLAKSSVQIRSLTSDFFFFWGGGAGTANCWMRPRLMPLGAFWGAWYALETGCEACLASEARN